MSAQIQKPRNEHMKKAVKILGGRKPFAEAVGVGKTTVQYWLNNERAPSLDNCKTIRKLTNGLVRPVDLRPDLYESML